MIVEAVAALAVPTAALLGGRAMAVARRPRLRLTEAAALGALAPPAAVACLKRPFVEQTIAWAVALVGWGGLLLGRDPYVLVASMLAGGVWAALLALPASGTPQRDGTPRVVSPPATAPHLLTNPSRMRSNSTFRAQPAAPP